ncbi:MAG: AraC family transcriptional regulator [bacterium]
MKPVLMRHVGAISESFKTWKNANPYVHNPFHYHPEIEITHIINGKGVLVIGDKAIPYNKDELILIAPNIPHEWRSERNEIPDNHTQSISIHFEKYFTGKLFYEIPETIYIKQLIEQAEVSIRIIDKKVKNTIKEYMRLLLDAKGIDRISLLLKILNSISTCNTIEVIYGGGALKSRTEEQNSRINKVFRYVIDNFKHTITIDDAAKEANLTNTSFCRFFKQRTRKSFIQYVNEVRVEYACKLLIGGVDTINQVAHKSGFENISNFNTQFKKIVHKTPREFIKLTSKPLVNK